MLSEREKSKEQESQPEIQPNPEELRESREENEAVEPKRGQVSHWEKKEKELFVGLDRKVEATRKLWKTLEAITLENTTEEVEQEVRGCIKDIGRVFLRKH